MVLIDWQLLRSTIGYQSNSWASWPEGYWEQVVNTWM